MTRALAWLVDSVMQISILALVCPLFFMGPIEVLPDFWPALVLAAVFVVNQGYFVFFETRLCGQSPGKRIFHLRVMRQDGRPVSLGDSCLRNLLRPADWLPFGYALGLVALVLGQRRQRLGDLAAGTVVVVEPGSFPLLRLPEPRDSIEAARRLSDRDLAWIHLFQQWGPLFTLGARRLAAQRLAQRLAARLAVDLPPNRSSEGFLADLASSARAGRRGDS